MKALLINGSPHAAGTTAAALAEVVSGLCEQGFEAEIVGIGTAPIRGCIGCGGCSKKGESRCVFDDDITNKLIAKAIEADVLVVGTPTYYAGANGALISVLDRMFYAASGKLRFKPAAAVAVARRAGTTTALDDITKYFSFCEMPIAGSQYWPVAFGCNGEQLAADAEGTQIMRTLGRNLAWLAKCIEAGAAAGIEPPEREPRAATNFVR